MHIWTDTPVSEIWNQLRYFSAASNVEAVLAGSVKSGRSAPFFDGAGLSDRSFEIASCIKQADEYFSASRNVGMATRPLLQFYGVQALSKAIIVANDETLLLQDIKYHGASSRPSTASDEAIRTNLFEYNQNKNLWCLENEFAITNDGVLPILTGLSGDGELRKGGVIYFKELLRIVPDISKIYERHYRESAHCIYLFTEIKKNENQNIEVIFDEFDKDAVLAVFPEFGNDYEEFEWLSHKGFRSIAPEHNDPGFVKYLRGAVGGKYAVRPHETGIYSTIPVIYTASFILSNVVRYKPEFWMGIFEGRSAGSSAMAEQICSLVERHFPNEILNTLWQEKFTFGSPGYMQ